jgi:aldehyde:ferredoxin oxidoreductase
MLGGYAGRYLDIDLSTGNIQTLELDKEMAEKYIGGGGFIAKILWDELPPDIDALSPENMLIITRGTDAISSQGMESAKSPEHHQVWGNPKG